MAKNQAQKAAQAAETSKGPTIREDIVVRILTVSAIAGDMARADQEHARARDENGGKLWQGYMELADSLGLEAFNEHYNSAKPEMVKPENADKYGSIPSEKKDGKYTLSPYITQTVSRIRGAMKLGIKLRNRKMELLPQTKLAQMVKEANAEKTDADRRKNDPNFEVRKGIAKELVEVSQNVRKGSHSLATLKVLQRMLSEINRVLKHDVPKGAEAADSAPQSEERKAA
jgi:hypothetical protein